MKFKEAKKYLDKGLKISSVKKDGYFEKVNDTYIRSVFYSDIGKVAWEVPERGGIRRGQEKSW